jgi:hypothetical protein
MNSEGTKRCDNLACLCEVAPAVAVCDGYCESPEARDAHNVRCDCGHAGCKEQRDRMLHGSAGRETLA